MAIDFTLTDEQKELQRTAREFAQEVLKPVVGAADAELDTQKAFQMMQPAYQQAYKLGFAYGFIPKRYGGPGYSNLDFQIVAEEIGVVDPGFDCILLCNGLALLPLIWYGSEDQKRCKTMPTLSGACAIQQCSRPSSRVVSAPSRRAISRDISSSSGGSGKSRTSPLERVGPLTSFHQSKATFGTAER